MVCVSELPPHVQAALHLGMVVANKLIPLTRKSTFSPAFHTGDVICYASINPSILPEKELPQQRKAAGMQLPTPDLEKLAMKNSNTGLF